jgi:hypothetical protein
MENELSYNIRGAAFKVHTELVPGLLESVYETALSYELRQKGYDVKSVETLRDVYHKQLLTYLKLSNKKLSLLKL